MNFVQQHSIDLINTLQHSVTCKMLAKSEFILSIWFWHSNIYFEKVYPFMTLRVYNWGNLHCKEKLFLLKVKLGKKYLPECTKKKEEVINYLAFAQM